MTTIADAATSVTAFIGTTARGPRDQAVPISSAAEYADVFGGPDETGPLGHCVGHFFANGGTQALIVSLASSSASLEDAIWPAGERTAAYLLEREPFNLLCVPGLAGTAAVARLEKLCADRRAFLVADAPSDATVQSLVDADRAEPGITGPFAMNAAIYFPWVLAADPLRANAPRPFPPCGFVAGLYARVDRTRGVWKAPAGTAEPLVGASGLAVALTDTDIGVLNPRGVNCLRAIPDGTVLVWGARTRHGQNERASEWKYVPVRRTALFIENSVERGLSWALFEPNGAALWSRIRNAVGTFLHGLFTRGAFQGGTPREAYFVKCDATTTSQDDINRGVVNVQIGFAPLRPAEFVVIDIRLLLASG